MPLPTTIEDLGVLRFTIQSICSSLIHLHKSKVCHRHLVPECFFVDAYGDIKIMTYQFAKTMKNNRTYTLCGTPENLAPEILKNAGYGFAVDWWGLGILILELISGTNPMQNENEVATLNNISSATDETMKAHALSCLEKSKLEHVDCGIDAGVELLSGFLKINPEERTQFNSEMDFDSVSFLRNIGPFPFEGKTLQRVLYSSGFYRNFDQKQENDQEIERKFRNF